MGDALVKRAYWIWHPRDYTRFEPLTIDTEKYVSLLERAAFEGDVRRELCCEFFQIECRGGMTLFENSEPARRRIREKLQTTDSKRWNFREEGFSRELAAFVNMVHVANNSELAEYWAC